MPVNVLYACHTASLTGSAVSMFQLMTNLDRTSFNPVAAFSKDGPIVERLASKGIPSHVLTRRGFLGFGLVRQAMDLIRSEDIDLVHLNSASPFVKYVGIAARLIGVPVVWHIREDPGGKRLGQLTKWIRLLAQRIFVVSSDLYEHFLNTGRVFKIYNGVDVSVFRPGLDGGKFRDRFNIPRGAFVFGMVGTIEERKGNILFLSAAEEISGEENLRFVLVGSGMPEEEKKVKDFLNKRPELADKTVFTGRLSDMPDVMAGIDVLVMPSLWEGFPRALIESMACGRPAVASDVGEVGRIIEDGRNGFVVPKGDKEALAAAMRRCMVARERLGEMGEMAREKAVSEYSIEKHVRAVCGRYDELLKNEG